jgi:hypothetical protein
MRELSGRIWGEVVSWQREFLPTRLPGSPRCMLFAAEVCGGAAELGNNIRLMARSPLLAVAVLSLALVPAAYASVSQTTDITDTHYSSYLERVYPTVAGVSWKVIDLNDEIRLINHSHETVTVYGYSQSDRNLAYDGGQYARILPDGTVQLNENSPAYYLNQSFYETDVSVPPSATDSAAPDWVTFAKTATLYWHDHRIHYTSPIVPNFIKARGVDRRQFVFAWYVPIQVGSTRGYLYGKLYWNAEKSFSFPLGAIIAFVVIVLGGVALVIVVRRRRGPTTPREAW